MIAANLNRVLLTSKCFLTSMLVHERYDLSTLQQDISVSLHTSIARAGAPPLIVGNAPALLKHENWYCFHVEYTFWPLH